MEAVKNCDPRKEPTGLTWRNLGLLFAVALVLGAGLAGIWLVAPTFVEPLPFVPLD